MWATKNVKHHFWGFMFVECDAAVENNISMQDEEEIAKKKQANRAVCRGYIDTSELARWPWVLLFTIVIFSPLRHRRIWKKSEKMQSKRRSTLTVWFFVQAASWLHQSLQTMPYHSFLKIVETPFSTPKCTWKMFAYLAFLLCPSIPSWWFQSPLEAATVVSSFPSSGRCWRRIKEGEVEERTIRDKGDQEGGLDSSWFKNIDLCGCFRK